MGESTLFHLLKQTKAIPQKGSGSGDVTFQHMRAGLDAFMANRTVTACAPARAGKALSLSHPHDQGNLTAEANGSHSWGWDVFACFSNGESPAGFFTQVLGKSTQEEAGLPSQKQLLKNSIQGPLSKTQCGR